MNNSVFSAFLQLGVEHIISWQAYDHLAFLVALAAPFIWRDWKQVVFLATAFTIGHSITLALAVLQIIPVDERIIETLIPVTILLTSLANFREVMITNAEVKTLWFSGKNLSAGLFGLIHGMGFSNYLKSLLGYESRPVLELFAFNVGIEIGQVFIVLLALLLNILAVQFLPRKRWIRIVSGVTALVSVYILFGIWQG